MRNIIAFCYGILSGALISSLLSFAMANTSQNEFENIRKIGNINGNGSIIAIIEFEGKRYMTSTAGGIIEIR